MNKKEELDLEFECLSETGATTYDQEDHGNWGETWQTIEPVVAAAYYHGEWVRFEDFFNLWKKMKKEKEESDQRIKDLERDIQDLESDLASSDSAIESLQRELDYY